MVYGVHMQSKQQAVDELAAQGVMGAIRWAYASAVARTLDDYSEGTGHNGAWLGTTRYTLTHDRLDRVFACGRYQLPADVESTTGLDLLHEDLTPSDIASMPFVARDLVTRDNLNSSPGWATSSYRFLLASGEFGKLQSIAWPGKSATKQLVARQPDPDPVPSLFDHLGTTEAAQLQSSRDDASPLELDTLIIAHSLDPVSKNVELVLGRPRFNVGGGSAWYWVENLWAKPPSAGVNRDVPSRLESSTDVPDAPVRLRPREDVERRGSE